MKCPKCGNNIVQRAGKYNSVFYACSGFPKCRQTWNNKQYAELCAGKPVSERVTRKPGKYNAKPLPRGVATNIPQLEGTQEQQEAWDHILDGRSVLLKARAGTGKSTALRQLCVRAPHANLMYVVFNRRNRDEALASFPTNTIVTTVNQLGSRAVCAYFGRYIDATKYKNKNMLSDQYGLNNLVDKEYMKMAANIYCADRIIKMAKNYVMVNITPQQIDWLVEEHNLTTTDEYGTIQDMVMWVMQNFHKKEIIDRYNIDFEDQILLPLIYEMPIEQVDAVLVDEGQDMAFAKQRLVIRAADQHVVVGDEGQAIYRFAGADSDSMNNMAVLMDNPIQLPLTINFRCGRKHIALAQAIVPDIRAHPNAPEGNIYEITEEDFTDRVKPGNIVVCRKNAPMVKRVYALLKKGISAKIAGRDFGEELEGIVKTACGIQNSVIPRIGCAQFIKKLESWYSDQRDKLASRRNSEALLDELSDKYEVLMILAERTNVIQDILDELTKIFSDQTSGNTIVFYSIHKAKGIEAPVVFCIEPDLLPMETKNPKDTQQELNLIYILVTRVLAVAGKYEGDLYFVGSMPSILRDTCAHLIN